jgi:hypothetical protein
MERLQYTVLITGTIAFAILIYFIVQFEKAEKIFQDKSNVNQTTTEEVTDFNQMTTEETTVYSQPDNNSSIIITVPAETKVKTTSETKFYFRVDKIDGHGNISDGYVSKKQLKRLP